jgi:hypothetical protein
MEQTLTLEGRDTVTSEESGRVETIGRRFDRHQSRRHKLALRMTWRHVMIVLMAVTVVFVASEESTRRRGRSGKVWGT